MFLNNLSNIKMIKTNIFILSLTILIVSCTQKPNGTESVVGEPLTNTEDISNGTTYQIDPASSVVTWIGSRPVKQHNGTIGIKEGHLVAEESDILGGKIIIDLPSIDIKSLGKDTEDYDKLKNHLMSEDFFYVDSFPTAKFELIALVPYDSMIEVVNKDEYPSENTPALLSEFMVKEPTHSATGNLTIRGITKSITFPAAVFFRNNKIFAEAKFNIDRTAWNIKYDDESSVLDKAKDKFIYNTVNVGFSLQALKED